MPKILVVDDEPRIGEVLEKFLTKSGFEVIKVISGKDAVEFLSSETKADLIILDIKMPNVTGFEIIKEKNRLDNKIPVIILTGTVDVERYSRELNQLGYLSEDIIYKPVDLFILLDRVKKKLGIESEKP